MQGLPHRPLISLVEIAQHLNVSVARLRGLCEEASPLPIPVHGGGDSELLSLASTRTLIDRALQAKSHNRKDQPHVHDRLGLLMWMVGLQDKPRKTYDRAVEDEIKRISKLPEPHRTLRALDLLARYVDAKVTAEALLKLKRLPRTRLPVESQRIEKRLHELTDVS